MKKVLKLISIVAVLMIVTCIGNQSVQTSQRNKLGDVLSISLESYFEVNGSYPSSLQQLIPEHLDTNELPFLYKKLNIHYWPENSLSSYRLGIDAGLMDMWIRNSGSKEWKYE